MVKVFLDTNVILDHALNRTDGEPEQARQILELAEVGSIICVISQGSLYTLAYVIKKAVGKEKTNEILSQYLSLLQLGLFTNESAEKAVLNPGTDIEDAFQYQTALLSGCEFFITRNLKDYSSLQMADLPCFSPSVFLNNLSLGF